MSDLIKWQTGLIEYDDVAYLRFFEYSGHFYDLETKSEHILPYGGDCSTHFIVSNCRCSLISLTEEQAHARSGFDKDGKGTGLNKIPELPDGGGMAQPDKGWDYNPFEDRMQWVNP